MLLSDAAILFHISWIVVRIVRTVVPDPVPGVQGAKSMAAKISHSLMLYWVLPFCPLPPQTALPFVLSELENTVA